MGVSKFNIHGTEIDVEDKALRGIVGDTSTLGTNSKTIVGAINEVNNKEVVGKTITYDETNNTLIIG